MYIPYYENEKLRILFVFQSGSVWSSWESFYFACKNDSHIEVKIALLEETVIENAQMYNAKKFLEQNSINYIEYSRFDFEKYVPHIVLVQFPYDTSYRPFYALSKYFYMKGSRVVYIPYGIEIADTPIARKDHFENFVVENSWRIYASTEKMIPEYKKYCRNRNAVRSFGSPKFDALYRKENYKLSEEIRKKKKNRKVVVWKMHFPKQISENGIIYQITPYIKEYLEFAKDIDKYNNLYFIVMFHPKMLRGMVESDIKDNKNLNDSIKKLIKILRNKENVYIDETDDYRNSLYNADLVIMDRSAVIVEAVMTKKPVLFMYNQDYKEKWTYPIEKIVDTLYKGTSHRDMKSFINKYLLGEDKLKSIRIETVSRMFPYYDGNCGVNIKNNILQEINLEKYNDKKKVILYGIGQVCRFYINTYDWLNNKVFKIVGLVDGNKNNWGKNYDNLIIRKPNEIIDMDFDIIVITTEQNYFEIKKYLVYELFLDERKIMRLDEFLWRLGNEDKRGKITKN